MSREGVIAEAHRILVGGRLTVDEVDGYRIRAVCRGDGGTYFLGYDEGEDTPWWCTCSAPGRCAHLIALSLVTMRGGGDAPVLVLVHGAQSDVGEAAGM